VLLNKITRLVYRNESEINCKEYFTTTGYSVLIFVNDSSFSKLVKFQYDPECLHTFCSDDIG